MPLIRPRRRGRRIGVLPAVVALHLAAAPAIAQVPDSTFWRATGELSLTDVSGNRDLSLFATQLTVERISAEDYAAQASAAARYGRSDGDLAAKSLLGQAELRLRPLDAVSPFFTASVERDEVRRLELRLAGSAGVDLNLVRGEARRLAVGAALLQDYERREPIEAATEDPTTSRTRITLRVAGRTPIREGITVEHESRVEPATVDFSDYLLRSTTALRAVLSSRLAFQTTYLFTRDNIPPEGVAYKDDRTLTVGLVIQFTPPAAP